MAGDIVAGASGAITPTGWLDAGSKVLGAALGGSAGPSHSETGGYFSFDNSGWTVATGKGTASASNGLPWYVWAGALVLGLAWLKRKH